MAKRLIVGMSGASGAPPTRELPERLRERPDIETHLIVSRGAELTLRQETEISPEELKALASAVYGNRGIGAALAADGLLEQLLSLLLADWGREPIEPSRRALDDAAAARLWRLSEESLAAALEAGRRAAP